MAFSYSPRIVTDGLVLYLDAANRKSYVSGDTVWNDLSTNSHIGTLNGNPTFSSSNYLGAFTFDGTGDYVTIPQGSGDFSRSVCSYEIWLYPLAFPSNGEVIFMDRTVFNGTSGIEIFTTANGGGTVSVLGSNSTIVVSTEVLIANAWNHLVVNYNGSSAECYINNVYESLGTVATVVNSTHDLYIGRYPTVANTFDFTGKISSVKVYNKNLSSDEVSQNYNALKGRFFTGLVTDGLITHYDAKDKRSHPGNTLRWNDLSGSQYNMTIDTSGLEYNPDGTFILSNGGFTYNGSLTTATTCTVVIWMKTTDLQAELLGGQVSHFIGRYNSGNKESHGNSGTPDFYMDLIERDNVYDYLPDGVWHMVEYKNVDLSAWTSINFNQQGSYTFGDGEVAIISIYDRSLTAAESSQNFGTFRSRFKI